MSEYVYCDCGFGWDSKQSNGKHDCNKQKMIELKPCPQCGGQTRNTQKAKRMCIECEMDLELDHNDWWYSKELEKKDAEILEQARLLGKSAEREADLLGKLERKDKLCSELLQALKEADDKGLFS